MVLYAAAQTGPVAFATTGISMSAQQQLFAATIEHSMEALVENAASHGRTEEESLRFAHGALRTIEIGLAGAGALGLFKLIKNGPALMSKCASLKAGLRQWVHEVFTRNQTNKANFEQQNAQRLYDALNKSPYSARIMEQLLQSQHLEANISSRTMPQANAKNVKLAGTRHPETGIVFNERGMPVFDDLAKVEVRISGNLAEMKPEAHKIAATKQLKADIEAGRVDRKLFSDSEWKQIEKGKPKIGEWTWHHHEDTGRMQLVPEELHKRTGHFGGDALWGMEKK